MSGMLPETIHLPDRVALATNALRGCLNPGKDHLPYCLVDLTGDPPRMRHTQFDYSDHTSRVLDALLLAERTTGSMDGAESVERLLPLFWGGFDDDGLHYTPENRWSFRHANMHYQRSVINALLALIRVRRSERAADQARALVGALTAISVHRDGFAYFPSVERLPDGWPRGDWEILGYGTDPANTNGRLIWGLTELGEELRFAPALELAGAYARHVMHHSSAFLPDGGFATGMEFREGHFHSRAVTMLGVIRYGIAAGDDEAVAWGEKVYRAARGCGTSFGWFPERLVESRAHGCETCAIVDMLEAAIWLGRSGRPEYWDDAERFLRNQLLESQLTSVDWLPPADRREAGADEWETTVDVAARSLGAFAGWSQPNSFVSKVMHEWDLYTCCTAQGVRGLVNAWDAAVSDEPGTVRVNLLINHDGPHATVRSALPLEGHVQVTPRQDAEIVLRIPGWVDPDEVRSHAAHGPVGIASAGPRHLGTRTIRAGDTVEFRFPVATRTRSEHVLGVDYTTRWRGDTVVDISPAAATAQLYQRSAFDPECVAASSSAPVKGDPA